MSLGPRGDEAEQVFLLTFYKVCYGVFGKLMHKTDSNRFGKEQCWSWKQRLMLIDLDSMAM